MHHFNPIDMYQGLKDAFIDEDTKNQKQNSQDFNPAKILELLDLASVDVPLVSGRTREIRSSGSGRFFVTKISAPHRHR